MKITIVNHWVHWRKHMIIFGYDFVFTGIYKEETRGIGISIDIFSFGFTFYFEDGSKFYSILFNFLKNGKDDYKEYHIWGKK